MFPGLTSTTYSAYHLTNAIIININEISGTYDVLLIDKETGDTIKNINKNINEIEWKFNVDYDGLFKNKSLYINTLVFDFKEKTCTVNIN